MQTCKSLASHQVPHVFSTEEQKGSIQGNIMSYWQTKQAAPGVLTWPQARPIPLSPMPCGHDKFNSRASAPEACKVFKENERKGKILFSYQDVFPIDHKDPISEDAFPLDHKDHVF